MVILLRMEKVPEKPSSAGFQGPTCSTSLLPVMLMLTSCRLKSAGGNSPSPDQILGNTTPSSTRTQTWWTSQGIVPWSRNEPSRPWRAGESRRI